MAPLAGLFPNISLRKSNWFQRYSSYLLLTQSHGNSTVASIVRQAAGATPASYVAVAGGSYEAPM